MILVIQKYQTGDEARDREIDHCLTENSRVFDRVVAVNGNARRWQFGELAAICGEYRGELCCIANSDISFDWSIRHADHSLTKCDLIALTRWENDSSPRMIGQVFGGRFFSGSQDAWIFRSGAIPAVEEEITLGHVGCDQRIVAWGMTNGLRVGNPCLSIKSRHHHAQPERPERPIAFGLYGYPQISTASVATDILCHGWHGRGFEDVRVAVFNGSSYE